MELSQEEKSVIEKISVISGLETEVVKKVFKTLLIVIDMNLYQENNNITIPYIAKIGIKYRDIYIKRKNVFATDISLMAEPSRFLFEEIDRISSDNPTLMEEHIKQSIDDILHKKINDE